MLGPETRAALRRYQEQNSLNADGRLTRETAESLGVARNGAYFETAGSSICNNYKDARSDVTHGATGAANRFKQRQVGSGFERFGRGMWHGIKAVGAGTADAAKDAYHGTRHALMGNR